MDINAKTQFVRISVPSWQQLCLGGRSSSKDGDSRRGGLAYWQKPTDHGGFYREVLEHPLGMAVYGFWCAFVDLVLNQAPDKRGSYSGFRGRPFQLARLARELGTDVAVAVSAIDHLARMGAVEIELDAEGGVRDPSVTSADPSGSQPGHSHGSFPLDSVATESNGIATESDAVATESDAIAFRRCGIREEKRREETRQETNAEPSAPCSARSDSADAEIGTEPEAPEPEPQPTEPTSPPEPLARWPDWWDPAKVPKGQRAAQASFARRFPELLAEWRAAFPHLDVVAEIVKAHAWEVANPGRKKTPRGRSRYLHGWLQNAQNRGGVRRNGPEPEPAQTAAKPPVEPPWIKNRPMGGAREIRPSRTHGETTFGVVPEPFPHGGWARHKTREVHRWLDRECTKSEPVATKAIPHHEWLRRKNVDEQPPGSTRSGPGPPLSRSEGVSGVSSRSEHRNAGEAK